MNWLATDPNYRRNGEDPIAFLSHLSSDEVLQFRNVHALLYRLARWPISGWNPYFGSTLVKPLTMILLNGS